MSPPLYPPFSISEFSISGHSRIHLVTQATTEHIIWGLSLTCVTPSDYDPLRGLAPRTLGASTMAALVRACYLAGCFPALTFHVLTHVILKTTFPGRTLTPFQDEELRQREIKRSTRPHSWKRWPQNQLLITTLHVKLCM